MLIYIVIAISVASLIGLSGGSLLLWQEKRIKKASSYLVSFAVGALLMAVFTDLLPELIEKSHNIRFDLALVFAGILLFYLLEKLLIVYHCHKNEECEIHSASSSLIIMSDTIHNFLDGMVIASAFILDLRVGIVTTLAVLLHEIPQESGDFAVLMHNGMKRLKVFLYNLISAGFSIIGGLLAYYLSSRIESLSTVLIALAAGNFIYIACTDLIPLTNKERKIKNILTHFAVLIVGIGIIYFVGLLAKEQKQKIT
ncbi:MAG: ZIP family metal transporter [Patescibacteria group bacterium]|jgi:zinc and cadmium transporter